MKYYPLDPTLPLGEAIDAAQRRAFIDGADVERAWLVLDPVRRVELAQFHARRRAEDRARLQDTLRAERVIDAALGLDMAADTALRLAQLDEPAGDEPDELVLGWQGAFGYCLIVEGTASVLQCVDPLPAATVLAYALQDIARRLEGGTLAIPEAWRLLEEALEE